jgi:hypothetical protein
MSGSGQVYEVRPCKDKRGSGALNRIMPSITRSFSADHMML